MITRLRPSRGASAITTAVSHVGWLCSLYSLAASAVVVASSSNPSPSSSYSSSHVAFDMLSPPPEEIIATSVQIPLNGLEVEELIAMDDGKTAELFIRRREGVSVMAASIESRDASTTLSAGKAIATPFDDGLLEASFSSSDDPCLSFIEDFLGSAQFNSCYPFSMLVQGSSSFLNAESSAVSMTEILERTCAANVTSCQTYLSQLADDLAQPSNCGSYLSSSSSSSSSSSNVAVTRVHNGLLGYQPLYSASCLIESSAYCYAGAVTNTHTTGDAYLYYLPLNMTYPRSANASCGPCNKKTMTIFQAATSDRASPIANTYRSAARALDAACGHDFANTTLSDPITSAASAVGTTPPSPPPPCLQVLLLLASAVAVWGGWVT